MSEDKQQIKPFFRVLNTDLIGEKPIINALLKIKGVGFGLANAICRSLNIEKTKKAGLFTEEEAHNIEALLKNSDKLPKWMFNRRLDSETGETIHVTGGDLKFVVENDIKKLKKIKAYRGMRHAIGQPTRGQRTRSHFRSGSSVGVTKSKVISGAKPAASAAKPAAKKGDKK